MTTIESIDFTEYSDDDLRQQYSLTYKIYAYYTSCLDKEKEASQGKRTYTLLLKQADCDLEDVKKELLRRGAPIPIVNTDTEEVSAEKNEDEAPPDDDTTSHGQVSYEAPVIVHKLGDSSS
jgi:hypothetical protein